MDFKYNAPQGNEVMGRAVRFLLYPNGTGVPTVSGMGVTSVSRTDTGTYLFTLPDGHYKCVKFAADLAVSAGGSNNRAQPGTISNLDSANPVAAYVMIRSATANVDVTASADDFISVEMVFEDSPVDIG